MAVPATPPAEPKRSWLPVAVLAAAQFVMVLDSSVMNVSISQIVADLDTSVQGVQLAITAYTLVMAALMLAGARLGDIWGRDRAFAVGLAIYGLGSLTTALSPNLTVLLIGWSGIEGIGAALVIPAIVSLIVGTYDGAQRAAAFGIIGGVAGAAIAAGPLIGGWVTTELSWRYVFAAETVIVTGILLIRGRILSGAAVTNAPRLDVVGVALSAAGLGVMVFGILKSSEWGWIEPRGALVINDRPITPLGFSAVPFLILIGLGLLVLFAKWESHLERTGRDQLVDRSLLSIPPLRAGLLTLMMQQLLLLGTFFVLPVYLQLVLGLDAFETGKRLFPMSVTMFIAALAGPRLAARMAPKRVAQLGLLALVGASVGLLGTIDVELNGVAFGLSLAMFGVGAGLLLSQLGNVIMSSAPPKDANLAGGLQGTAQNLGASLGTALIGSVLIASLTTGFLARIDANPAVPEAVKVQLAEVAEQGIPVASIDQVEASLVANGVEPTQAEAIALDYGDAELDALRRALGAVALLALLSLFATSNLPGASTAPSDRSRTGTRSPEAGATPLP